MFWKRTVTGLSILYFCQGLPYGFFTQAIPVVLRTESVSLGWIGASSLLALPWALKFLWAPLVDDPGRRRRRIVGSQLLTALGLLALSFQEPNVVMLAIAAFALNLVIATQDIWVDGFAVDETPESHRALINAVQVGGYRFGMIAGGGLLLTIIGAIGLRAALVVMAVVIAAAAIPTSQLRESRWSNAPSKLELAGFFREAGIRRWFAVLFVYKLGDALANAMVRPMLVDFGYGLSDLGLYLGTYGFAAALVGSGAAVLVLRRTDVERALAPVALLQAVGLSGYALVALSTHHIGVIAAICFEHFASGMATTVLFSAMMSRCRPTASGVDYSAQASWVVIATGSGAAISGVLAQSTGYFGLFVLAALVGVVGAILSSMEARPISAQEVLVS